MTSKQFFDAQANVNSVLKKMLLSFWHLTLSGFMKCFWWLFVQFAVKKGEQFKCEMFKVSLTKWHQYSWIFRKCSYIKNFVATIKSNTWWKINMECWLVKISSFVPFSDARLLGGVFDAIFGFKYLQLFDSMYWRFLHVLYSTWNWINCSTFLAWLIMSLYDVG